MRSSLAPVVYEHGQWTYAAPFPRDMFSALDWRDQLWRYYSGLGPRPVICR